VWSTYSNLVSLMFRVVEYRTPEEARRAIQTLNDTQLLGRPVFIREVPAVKTNNDFYT
jgi:hypothetical protein